ncbi:hypothetical protein [Streptomyces celluloflavus]|uniref:hypothetical protein n=1 Tax=Streptomyces celluloflavus TaxID=58344 RepID=UPI0036678D76
MDATQQHMLDAYRAAQTGAGAPPLPAAGTVRTAREIQQWHRFQAVVTDPADRLPGRARRAARAVAAFLAGYLGPRRPLPPPAPTPAAPPPTPTTDH